VFNEDNYIGEFREETINRSNNLSRISHSKNGDLISKKALK
jgi:hypothetical protein